MPISPPSDSPPPANAQLRAKATTSRQQKKRELDRRAQRLSRERTKARIAHLEQLVEEFRDKDTSGQVRVLTEQLQTVTKQRDALTGLLRTLQSSIKQHITPQSDCSAELSPGHAPRETATSRGGNPGATAEIYSPCEVDSVSLSATADEQGTACANETAIEALDGFHDPPAFPELMPEPVHDVPPLMGDFFPDLSEQLIVPTPSFDDPIVPAATPACDCYHSHQLTAPSWKLNLWRFANEVLTPQPQGGGNNTPPDYELEYDVPIRAIVEGWPAVEARLGTLPESWRKLRAVDQVLFHACGSVERLAILRMMHSLLMYHSEPSAERRAALPAWYLQRPSQAIAHSYAIDFFAWPGIRERFVFSQHRYCANIFWHLFASSLRLLWPFELRDAYTTNTETGRFGFSDTFESRIRDIGAWTMTGDFFDHWPELYSDIPRFPHLLSVPSVALKMPQQQQQQQQPRKQQRRIAGSQLGTRPMYDEDGRDEAARRGSEVDRASSIGALGWMES